MAAVCVLELKVAAAASHAGHAAGAHAAHCSAAPYRQFDFWLGDWDVYSVESGKLIARAQVTPVLAGCALSEDYRSRTGYAGRSFSAYDASRGVWHQSWVSSEGEILVIEGGLREGAMELCGADQAAPQGPQRWTRGVWRPAADTVRETATRSTDGRKTWQPWFDIVFRRHRP